MGFFVDIVQRNFFPRGQRIQTHWHEHLQFFYFTAGAAWIECEENRFKVSPGNLVVINSNELHSLESLSDDLQFYVIRVDATFLSSNQMDLLQIKYLSPLMQNRISFKNLIQNDTQIRACVANMIHEFVHQKMAYELAVKASVYQLIVLLLRDHVEKILKPEALVAKAEMLKRFEVLFRFVEENYHQMISLKDMAKQVSMGSSHFCRMFKKLTGKSSVEYLNSVRLGHAAVLLKDSDWNMTEIAFRCGFEGLNYFSRLFRRHYRCSPTEFRKKFSEEQN